MNCTKDMFKYEIVHLNIRGARSNKENLEEYLATMKYPEIVCLNETKLPLDARFEVSGYNLVARKEQSAVGGYRGSLILTRSDIKNIVEIEHVKNSFPYDEVIGIELKQTQNRPGLKVFTYYNPPMSVPNKLIMEYVASLSGNCILTGDLNCKNTVWGSTRNDRRGTDLLNLLSQLNLITLNDDSKTRCDPVSGKEESLDVIIGNCDAASLFANFWVGPDVGSDHYPVHASLQFKAETPEIPIKIRKIQKLNHTKWKSCFNSFSSLPVSKTPNELDRNAVLLSCRILAVYQLCCPETQIRKNAKHEFTPEIKALVKEKRRMRREKNVALQQGDMTTVRLIMTRINRLGNDIKKIQKKERQNRLHRHCSKLNTEKNSKKFFESFNIVANPILQKEQPSSSTKPVMDDDGKTACTSQDKANLFASRLQRTHREPDFQGFDNSWKTKVEEYLNENEKIFKTKMELTYEEEEQGDDSHLIRPISIQELQENLAKCKNRSATGKDAISYAMIKKLPERTQKDVCQLFSDAFRLGYFPKIWKNALVKMIPKPQKDSKLAKNHRPISLLSCLGKILERVTARRLSIYLEEKNMFSNAQSGFRSHRMTSEQLLRLSEESYRAFKKKQTVAALFLDAEAAFDRCWHNGLKYKLKNNLKLPDRLTRLLSSFITDRTLTVEHEGCTSSLVHLEAGTPQGSPLSPILYIIYVNDFPEAIQQDSSLSQFADDTAMWAVEFTKEKSIKKLQRSLNYLEGWCRRWRVKLNGEKSQLLFITRTRKKDNENHCLHLFNDIIRPSDSAKFLGVEIDTTMSFKKHFESVEARATKRVNVLKVLAKGGVKPRVLMRLYNCYVRSLFEYGSSSFISASKLHLSRLQKIQNNAIRACLGLPRYLRTTLIHDCASIETVFERLTSASRHLLSKMMRHNDNIRELVESHVSSTNGNHLSPLDILL